MATEQDGRLAKKVATCARLNLPLEHDVPALVNTMKLKYVLCQVESDRHNLPDTSTLAHQCRLGVRPSNVL
jgi:hypothetical protein